MSHPRNVEDLKNGDKITLGPFGHAVVSGDPISVYPFKKVKIVVDFVQPDRGHGILELPGGMDLQSLSVQRDEE